MKVNRQFMLDMGVCSEGDEMYMKYTALIDELTSDGDNSHKAVYKKFWKYYRENKSVLNTQEWKDSGGWFRHLAESPAAIIAGGDSVVGEQYKLITVEGELLFDTLAQAQSFLNQRIDAIAANPFEANKVHYWVSIDRGKQTVAVLNETEMRAVPTVCVFEWDLGYYIDDLNHDDAMELITRFANERRENLEQHNEIFRSVRDSVDHYLTWEVVE